MGGYFMPRPNTVSDEHFSKELELRLSRLENPTEQGADFDRFCWFWLITLGLVAPALLVLAWSLA